MYRESSKLLPTTCIEKVVNCKFFKMEIFVQMDTLTNTLDSSKSSERLWPLQYMSDLIYMYYHKIIYFPGN